MPGRRSSPDTVQFTITLSRQSVEDIERLMKSGRHGTTRAAVAAEIIRDYFKDLWKAGKLPD